MGQAGNYGAFRRERLSNPRVNTGGHVTETG